MYAELVINIEAPLAGTFHYFVPIDLRDKLAIGHLVEVDFGRRLAQGIVVGFDKEAPVEETKPIIAVIDPEPIVRPWQIELAEWLSEYYLTPLNACLRLMLPPGLTRWADVIYDLNPYWDGSGRLTETQDMLVNLLREHGDMRGRQISRVTPKGSNWRAAADQLVRREILRKASVLDPPRVQPKTIRTVELSAGPDRILHAAMKLGRKNRQAEILYYLLSNSDPLPFERTVLEATKTSEKELNVLADEELIRRSPATTIIIPLASHYALPVELEKFMKLLPIPLSELPEEYTAKEGEKISDGMVPQPVSELLSLGLIKLIEQPATISLAIPTDAAVPQLYALRSAKKYYDVLANLSRAGGPVAVKDLYSNTGATFNHLRKLEGLELLRFGTEEIWRDPLADRDYVPVKAPILTADQARVWGRIKMSMLGAFNNDEIEKGLGSLVSVHDEQTPSYAGTDIPKLPHPHSPKPVLLHGVTGSGKTEIYLRAVELALEQGQQAIVLVPEIALTPQTIRRFAARFPGQVALLHSRLSDGERFDTWRRARDSQFSIVVGPRSALFIPFDNLGVIVVDEEHDHSYKQTPPVPPPYYHARDVAIQLGQLTGAMVVIGSATPNIVTYHQAQSGRYLLLELPKRIMGHRQRIEGQVERFQRKSLYQQTPGDPDDALMIGLPPVQIVDMRQELKAGNRSIFSRQLQKAMDETLSRNEQAILFLNRRGTATFIMCRDCGYVLNCPRCEVPLTYHQPGTLLVCHYCGRKESPHKYCPRCGSHRIKYFGLGTEEVQNRVQIQWPQARTVRWDRDTTAGKDTHEMLLASFINQEADILVGTQMIAKGLDLPLVTLVGVISADVSLGLPDYGIGERTFQVLTQVAGRAGRGLLGGRVIVQTYQPDHYAIRAAAEHDYTTFFLDEIRFRTRHNLPPFRRLARLIVADPVSERAEREARALAQALARHSREKALSATELIGPTPPFFHRLDGRYRWQIIIRSPDPIRFLQDFQIPQNWIIDIDPVSIL